MCKLLILMLAAMIAAPAFAQAAGATLDQYQAAARTRLMKADGNGDGRISKDEWIDCPRASANPKVDTAQLFERLDTNLDGALDQAEIDALLARRFARMDVNADGTLTAAERQTARGRAND